MLPSTVPIGLQLPHGVTAHKQISFTVTAMTRVGEEFGSENGYMRTNDRLQRRVQ